MPITLSNPMRVIVPIGTLVLLATMLAPPLLLADWSKEDPAKMGIGVSVLLLCAVWLASSAWRAPFALRVEGDELVVRQLMRERRYGVSRVKKWWFAVPEGPITQSPPETNGLLYVVFDDRVRFRGEVTGDEARAIAGILGTK